VTDTDLKPCPFCGGAAVVVPDDNDCWSFVECKFCAAQSDGCRTKEDAIAAWNRRAKEPTDD